MATQDRLPAASIFVQEGVSEPSIRMVYPERNPDSSSMVLKEPNSTPLPSLYRVPHGSEDQSWDTASCRVVVESSVADGQTPRYLLKNYMQQPRDYDYWIREQRRIDHQQKSKMGYEPAPMLTVQQLNSWVRERRFFSSLFRDFSLTDDPRERGILESLQRRVHVLLIDDQKMILSDRLEQQSLYDDLNFLVEEENLNLATEYFTSGNAAWEAGGPRPDIKNLMSQRCKTHFSEVLVQTLEDYVAIMRNHHADPSSLRRIAPLTVLAFIPICRVLDHDSLLQQNETPDEFVAAIGGISRRLDEIGAPFDQLHVRIIRCGESGPSESLPDLFSRAVPEFATASFRSRTSRRILEVMSADDNVWKMMLGSFDSSWNWEEDQQISDEASQNGQAMQGRRLSYDMAP